MRPFQSLPARETELTPFNTTANNMQLPLLIQLRYRYLEVEKLASYCSQVDRDGLTMSSTMLVNAFSLLTVVVLSICFRKALACALKPGGVGVLVIDMVSFLSMKASKYDKLKAEGDWDGLADLVEKENNFFHGTRRESVVAALKTGRLHNLIDPKSIELLKPWQWKQGQKRFLVYGVLFSRR